MRRIIVLLLMLSVTAGSTAAQTETPTPTPTVTHTPEPYAYATIAPELPDTPGQMMRFDYVVSAADVHIANLLTWLLYSVWAFFFMAVLVLGAIARNK